MDSLLFISLVILVIAGIFAFAVSMSVVALREADRAWATDTAPDHTPIPVDSGVTEMR